jgi:hypothetical protein
MKTIAQIANEALNGLFAKEVGDPGGLDQSGRQG